MMDQLAMDAKRAMDDGYGSHYGLWKSLHPRTKEENEPLIRKYLEEEKKTAAQKREEARYRTCPICGKKFLPTRKIRVCCSDECRKEYHRRGISIRTYANCRRTVKCAQCGKLFESTSPKPKKYCCAACANAARYAQRREATLNMKRMGITPKQKTVRVLYTVWNNSTGDLVIKGACAQKCAEAMGIQLSSFRSAVYRKNRPNNLWRIERQEA